jgi:hypothetical protein
VIGEQDDYVDALALARWSHREWRSDTIPEYLTFWDVLGSRSRSKSRNIKE